MGEFDDMPGEERFKLQVEAIQIYVGLRLKCLQNAVCELADAIGAKPDYSSSLQEQLEKDFRTELEDMLKTLSQADPARASLIERYLKELDR